MLNFMQRINRRRSEDGASAVEYGLLVAAIAALIVLIVFAVQEGQSGSNEYGPDPKAAAA